MRALGLFEGRLRASLFVCQERLAVQAQSLNLRSWWYGRDPSTAHDRLSDDHASLRMTGCDWRIERFQLTISGAFVETPLGAAAAAIGKGVLRLRMIVFQTIMLRSG
jgi:hypothetical protein